MAAVGMNILALYGLVIQTWICFVHAQFGLSLGGLGGMTGQGGLGGVGQGGFGGGQGGMGDFGGGQGGLGGMGAMNPLLLEALPESMREALAGMNNGGGQQMGGFGGQGGMGGNMGGMANHGGMGGQPAINPLLLSLLPEGMRESLTGAMEQQQRMTSQSGGRGMGGMSGMGVQRRARIQSQFFGPHSMLSRAVRAIVHPEASATQAMVNIAMGHQGPPSSRAMMMEYMPYMVDMAFQYGIQPTGTIGRPSRQVMENFIIHRGMAWMDNAGLIDPPPRQPSRVQGAPPVRNPLPPVRNPSPPVRNPSPPVRNPSPPVRNPSPPVRSPSPPVRNPSPPTRNPSPPARNPPPAANAASSFQSGTPGNPGSNSNLTGHSGPSGNSGSRGNSEANTNTVSNGNSGALGNVVRSNSVSKINFGAAGTSVLKNNRPVSATKDTASQPIISAGDFSPYARETSGSSASGAAVTSGGSSASSAANTSTSGVGSGSSAAMTLSRQWDVIFSGRMGYI